LRNLLRIVLAATAILTFGVTASAQWGRHGGQWRPERVSALIDRVHDDLSRGYSVWRLSGGDRDRLDHAEKHLREFAERWQHGDFDKGKLDDAIGAIQKTIDDNHLNGRERDALWRDVTQLRNMREAYNRHEIGRW